MKIRCILSFLFIISVHAGLYAQRLEQAGSFLITTTRDTVPMGEVWKITGGFGAQAPVMPESPSAMTDTAALAKKYRDMYNLTLDRIHPMNFKGGMVLKDALPVWIQEGTVFSIDPGDLMELFAERYRIVRN